MKLKFSVTAKDFATFIAFSVFLLFACSLGIGNLLRLLRNTGDGLTLNPFIGFLEGNFFVTLVAFLIVEGIIISSVSSSIFQKSDSSGIGLSIGEKESKGYSRWLKEKEMKKQYKVVEVGVQDADAPAAGVVLINNGKKMWVDDGEFHTLVIGVTGSGKTSAVINPLIYSLIKHKESMVMTDPKGELYRMHANHLKARGYDVIVLNFREPEKGNAWNPLTLPYKLYKEGNIDKAVELVDDVGKNVVKDKKADDPFWQDSAGDYFSGCALGLIQDAKEEEVNINSINIMTTVGEEKFGAGSNYIKEYFGLKGEESSAYVFASNTINSPTETKGGILSTFRQKIRVFASRENLSEMLSHSDFDMADIGKKPTAVFIVIHDEKTTYHALATIFIKQCYETLIDVAQANGGALPVRTNFLLDEFANMPALKDVTTMVTAARSRHIRFTFIIQNFAQLNEVYGKDDAETIRSNCGNLIYLLTTELAALEEISKLCGEVKSKKDDKSESHPLITVADLQKLQMNEVIILRNRAHPFKTKFTQAFNVDWGDEQYPEAEFETRPKEPIQIFDVKEFVKLRMKSKMGINGKGGMPMGGGSPLGQMGGMGAMGGMGGNPFAGLMGGAPSGGSAPRSISSFEEMMKNQGGGVGPRPTSPDTGAPSGPKPGGFNIEELMKKIDAKIAELEAEEEAENKANESKKTEENKINPLIGGEGAKDLESTPKKPEIPAEPEFVEAKGKEVSSVSSFSDMINKAKENASQPVNTNPMVSNPIDTTSVAPKYPTEPIINKPLTGIIDPTKQMTYDSFGTKDTKEIIAQPVAPAAPKVEAPAAPVKQEPTPVPQQPKVNPYAAVSDDEFFDDFFDEE